MKALKSLAALALTAALAVSLAACSGGGQTASDDIIQQTAGIPADEVLFTLDGQEITAEEYLYWAAYSADYLVNYYLGSVDNLDWSDESTLSFVRTNALDAVSLYRQAQLYAGELGITLTEEEQAALDADIQETIDTLGSEEAYALRLQQSAISEEGFRDLLTRFYLYSALIDRLYGPEGTQPLTEADLQSYIDENGIYRAKHILLLTMDMTTGEPLDDDTVAAKKALADELLAQLRESENPLTLFDQLMNEYSEDTGLEANPDGYTTQVGQMVSAFEDTALALEVGEISEVVESEYGYHIILRLSVDPEDYRTTLASARLDDTLYQRVDGQTVEYTDAYDSLDLGNFYTALTAFRESVSEG